MESMDFCVFGDRDVLVGGSPLGPIVQAWVILVVVHGIFVSCKEYFNIHVSVEPIDSLVDRSGTCGHTGCRNELQIQAED